MDPVHRMAQASLEQRVFVTYFWLGESHVVEIPVPGDAVASACEPGGATDGASGTPAGQWCPTVGSEVTLFDADCSVLLDADEHTPMQPSAFSEDRQIRIAARTGD